MAKASGLRPSRTRFQFMISTAREYALVANL